MNIVQDLISSLLETFTNQLVHLETLSGEILIELVLKIVSSYLDHHENLCGKQLMN